MRAALVSVFRLRVVTFQAESIIAVSHTCNFLSIPILMQCKFSHYPNKGCPEARMPGTEVCRS